MQADLISHINGLLTGRLRRKAQTLYTQDGNAESRINVCRNPFPRKSGNEEGGQSHPEGGTERSRSINLIRMAKLDFRLNFPKLLKFRDAPPPLPARDFSVDSDDDVPPPIPERKCSLEGALDEEFQSRFTFHPVSTLPLPEVFNHWKKTYPSQTPREDDNTGPSFEPFIPHHLLTSSALTFPLTPLNNGGLDACPFPPMKSPQSVSANDNSPSSLLTNEKTATAEDSTANDPTHCNTKPLPPPCRNHCSRREKQQPPPTTADISTSKSLPPSSSKCAKTRPQLPAKPAHIRGVFSPAKKMSHSTARDALSKHGTSAQPSLTHTSTPLEHPQRHLTSATSCCPDLNPNPQKTQLIPSFSTRQKLGTGFVKNENLGGGGEEEDNVIESTNM